MNFAAVFNMAVEVLCMILVKCLIEHGFFFDFAQKKGFQKVYGTERLLKYKRLKAWSSVLLSVYIYPFSRLQNLPLIIN